MTIIEHPPTSAPPAIVPAPAVDPGVDGPIVRRADRYLLVGAVLLGASVFGPIGLVPVGIGLVLLGRARRAGEYVRPAAVTIFAVFSIVDAGANFLGWSLDTFAHSTHLAQTFLNGFGRMFDGGYYYQYNSRGVGGVSVAGEKGWEIFAVLGLFPLRMAAAWAFMKLKRWGFTFMVITSWGYVFFWFGYLTNVSLDFPHRMGATMYGVFGWWCWDVWYLTPFITLPWLYMLDRRRWNR